ncbi:MAG: ligT like phosphoesterase [Streptococcus gallolyticus]|uniref:LigT like phosphoesterase n=1 Tax=Streptococcus gallolyticus TaxID=315405 RepID=A0A927XME5_9STRE|nr:ligT like phosphoesterase [Streptococcus gallolyticus]
METFAEFLERIDQFEQAELSLPEEGFLVSPSLNKKVHSDNTFRDFYGDTVVFDLAEKDKVWLATLVQKLYDELSVCFAEAFPVSSYHMTLHDLSSGSHLSGLTAELETNCQRLKRQLLSQPLFSQKIKMRSNFIFNMVNTSLVMGLVPASEADYTKLTSLYALVDDVKALPYPFTPHITLAYYNIDGFSAEQVRKLKGLVVELNKTQHDFVLDSEKLYYQTFTSMKEYQSVFPLFKE